MKVSSVNRFLLVIVLLLLAVMLVDKIKDVILLIVG